MHRQPCLHRIALTTSLLLAVGAAGAEQPLNDAELKAREAGNMAAAIEAAAKAQSAVNAAQLPSVGDLSKYKLDAPEVKLDAQAAALAYEETGLLAKDVAEAILKALYSPKATATTKATLLLAAPRTRTCSCRRAL